MARDLEVAFEKKKKQQQQQPLLFIMTPPVKLQFSLDDFFKKSKYLNPVKAAAKPVFQRQDSVLTSLDDDAGFDDVDVSYDTSVEVVNLRNTVLPTQTKRSADVLEVYQPRKLTKVEPTKEVAPQEICLSPEQQMVVDTVVHAKESIFFTGSAGTGKSVVLKEMVKACKGVYGDNFGVTASTGLAACNIQGQTVHRYLGIGFGRDPVDKLAAKVRKNVMLLRKWQQMRLLIIDEISMIDAGLFDKIEEVARIVRNNEKPFGGIQIVACGDFYQLPPVNKDGKARFCFEGKSWHKVIKKSIVLKQVFRQKGDTEFIDMLNALRLGNLNAAVLEKFATLQREIHYEDKLEPTELFPTLNEVRQANLSRLARLPGKERVFVATDRGDPRQHKMLDNLMCEKVLRLKEGAQVMNIVNYSEDIVNGSLGMVLFFATRELYYKFIQHYGPINANDEDAIKEMRFICHRIDESEYTAEEKEYYEGLLNERKEWVQNATNVAVRGTGVECFPVVNFKTRGSDVVALVDKQDFKMEKASKKVTDQLDDLNVLAREQLPLLLAWAMSIHKSQGQTLDRVRVDLGRSFADGQAYVALSRATSKDRLELRHFRPDKVTTSNAVRMFYQSLEQV